MQSERLIFIDYMKAIAMLAIVVGHFFPPHLQYLTYAFDVQLFFFVSGFLFHRSICIKDFFQKQLKTLIVPYILLGLINILWIFIHNINIMSLSTSLLGLMVGFHNINGIVGCGSLWFIITLLVLKIINQTIKIEQTKIFIILFVLSIISSYAYKHILESTPYKDFGIAIGNTFIAYPFYALGNYIRNYKEYIVEFCKKTEMKFKICCFISGVSILFFIFFLSPYNGNVRMYIGGYGNNILLFFIFSALGIIGVALLSIGTTSLRKLYNPIRIINAGTIMILAFHQILIGITLSKILNRISSNDLYFELGVVVSSILILIIFLPIIKFSEKYTPFLIGMRK